mmetsp:Transcript_10543/g.28616  ORF Transcript_10543/g.28616 Transcript_10543/m.28616 type:complete len:600 (-) Transcript_10543:80-1879(-)
MAPPRGGERSGKESNWVKKGGATEKPGDGTEDDDDKGTRGERREAGRGRGRQPREPRGRREPREKVGAQADAEDGVAEGGRGSSARGRGGRAQRGTRRGSNQETAADEKENQTLDEAGEANSGTALLTMLKANPPKVTRYTKGELLSIARLPASQIKPPDLCPLIDKENKESQLLVRMTGGRAGVGDAEDGMDVAGARRERRERHTERRGANHEQGEDVEVAEELRPRRGSRENAVASLPGGTSGATGAAMASAAPADASSPSRGRAAATAPGITPDKNASFGTAKTSAAEEDVDIAKASRAYQKWFDPKKMMDQPSAGSAATPPSASPAQAATPPASAGANANVAASLAAAASAGQSGMAPAAGGQYPASFLQQQGNPSSQAQALGQAAYAMQAAAYMQAMSMNAAAVAARGAYGNNLAPWGYNPFLFPPYTYGGAYPPNPDYNTAAQAPGTKKAAAQAKLAAAQAAASAASGLTTGLGATGAGLGAGLNSYGAAAAGRGPGAGAGLGGAAAVGKAAARASPKVAPKAAPMPVSPQLRASMPGPVAGPAVLTAKKAPLEGIAAQASVEALTKTNLQVAAAKDEGEKEGEEDDAGCSQS